MDPIRFLALLRGVKNEAAKLGYHGDALAEGDSVPDCGTYEQEMAIASIRLDVRPRPTNDAQRQLVLRLVRAVVLGSPQTATAATSSTSHLSSHHTAMDRAKREAVAYRRQQSRRTRR
jgi:hypothetical protein